MKGSQMKYAAIRALCLLPFGFSTTAANAEFVTVRTISTQGQPVIATVAMSLMDGPWKTAEGELSRDGSSIKIFLSTCDGNTKFKASYRDNIGFHTRKRADGIKYCQLGEVLFDDYVPTQIASTLSLAQLIDPNAWQQALGTSDRSVAERYAASFETAFKNGDYGYLAIASGEIAASLRKAGSSNAAIPFENLSIQSTVAGVIGAKGDTPTSVEPFTVTPGVGKLTLNTDAQKILRAYQEEDLKLPVRSPEVGKTGWATMRSLPGGDQVKAVEWKLDLNQARGFDAKVFSPIK